MSQGPQKKPPPEARRETIQALDELIRLAEACRASDIHLEPTADRLRVRYRIDGVLAERAALSAKISTAIVNRIKVLSRMDIAERRQPQDGMFKVSYNGQEVSVRASTFPGFHGEKAVLRLLHSGSSLPLDSLGMAPDQVKQMRRLIKRNGGLLLVTGPTGSGKTSTLYALLSELDTTRLNIVTLEDPIEVQLPNITQGQVHRKAGFTFASGLRAILRQDPDVILVGEMRDTETAQIAIQASLTGHLVLSTMHTNSTIATITRLMDIGLEPYIVASALLGVLAQRLVREVCPHCSETYILEGDVSGDVGFSLPPKAKLKRAIGCQRCQMTGFSGRRGIFEIVEINDKLRQMIKSNADATAYKHLLRAMKVPSLRREGIRQAIAGSTTANEVLRVT